MSNKYYNDVLEFHKTYNCPIGDKDTILTPDRMLFRLGLVEEEFDELLEAISNADKVEIVDALIDMLYFINGTFVESGYDTGPLVLKPNIITLDHTNLLLKLSSIRFNIDNAKKYIKDHLHVANDNNYLQRNLNIQLSYIRNLIIDLAVIFNVYNYFEACHNEIHRSNMSKLDANGKPIFREDGKVLKSDLYSPPNLSKIIYASSQETANTV